ncbi:MAG: 50S ribosomal protein L11 methyltransferase [Turicibacter sp.]
MNWLELCFHTTHDAFDLVSNIFIDAGSKGVLVEDSNTLNEVHEDHFGEIYRLNPDDYPQSGVIIKGYLAVTTDIESKLEFVRTQLLNLKIEGVDHNKLEINTLDEEDWANSWKQHYAPIQVSDRLVIKPCWLEPSTDKSVVEIMLDPGMAFGSGTHETTQLCLELIEKYIKQDDILVDVGTGSGILAIAGSKLGSEFVYAVDLDQMAVVRAINNVEMNQCTNILVEKNNLIDGVSKLEKKPTMMIANILAPIIINMLDDVVKVLPKGQLFICSGIVEHEKESVVTALEAHQFEIVEIKIKNGWVAIVAK